jgi:hypothetical protein
MPKKGFLRPLSFHPAYGHPAAAGEKKAGIDF